MSTPGGLPYPVSTDDLNQGANDIKALAEALAARGLDKFVQTGSAAVHFQDANGALVFPIAFSGVPTLLTAGNVPNTIVFLAQGAVSATGCPLTLFELWPNLGLKPAAVDVTVFFIAVGPR